MTSNHFADFMYGYLKDTGNKWVIEISTPKNKKKKWPKYDPTAHSGPNYSIYSALYNAALKDPEMNNQYTMYITDKNDNLIMKSDEFVGGRTNSWSSTGYGNFIRTLKKV